jgi:DnaJ-class molecular chaperone
MRIGIKVVIPREISEEQEELLKKFALLAKEEVGERKDKKKFGIF